jgi:hypothetical protein
MPKHAAGHAAIFYKNMLWDKQPYVPDMAWHPGVYRVHWASGGDSLATVGVTRDGKRWLAPINWIEPSSPYEDWDAIESMELAVLDA